MNADLELAKTLSTLAWIIISSAPILLVGFFSKRFAPLALTLAIVGFMVIIITALMVRDIYERNCSPTTECYQSIGIELLPIFTIAGTFFWIVFRFFKN